MTDGGLMPWNSQCYMVRSILWALNSASTRARAASYSEQTDTGKIACAT